MASGDFEGAQSLLSPEIAIGFTPELLEQLWQGLEIANDIQIGDAHESGNTASVDITFIYPGDFTQGASVELRRNGDKWYITNPLSMSLENIPTFEIPTIEPFDFPTPLP
jgi:hypothetical protein